GGRETTPRRVWTSGPPDERCAPAGDREECGARLLVLRLIHSSLFRRLTNEWLLLCFSSHAALNPPLASRCDESFCTKCLTVVPDYNRLLASLYGNSNTQADTRRMCCRASIAAISPIRSVGLTDCICSPVAGVTPSTPVAAWNPEG